MKAKTTHKPINAATLNQRKNAKIQGKSRRAYRYEKALISTLTKYKETKA